MNITVITVVYNNELNIKDCMESVKSQTHSDIEHIIVDGKSTDGTCSIVEENLDTHARLISEKDEGIYDAMNRGIREASGDVVGFLNSDDLYFDENTISKINSLFENFDVDCCYGDLVYVDKFDTDKIVRKWVSGEFNINRLKNGWHPPHPTFYVKRKLLMKHGGFYLKYKIASDYALMIRLLYRERISTGYIPETLVKMRTGGKSNQSLKNILTANYESYRAWKDIGVSISPLVMVRKPLGKLRQFYPGIAYDFLKRALDFLLSFSGLIVSSPLWIVIAIMVKGEDGGPVFYTQKRVGKNERLFTAYKFRSMIPQSDSIYGNLQAQENDKRITRVGKVLRNSAMDELPQLLSILKGDMSFVGPRALLPDEIEKNGDNRSMENIRGYRERHSVKPGLTGIAQIYAPRDLERKNKFRYDLLYLKKKNFLLDIKLILLSFWITFRGTWESRESKF